MVAVAALLAVVLVLPPAIPLSLPRFRWRLPRRVTAAQRRAAELEWVEALAAELRAGRDLLAALVAADTSTAFPVSVAGSAAARSGGDVAQAWRSDPRASELLRGAAACWEVAEGSGAGLAAALTTLADSAREGQRVRDELRAGLAEPRATAVVLACLPLLGLALGSLLGADPVAWLFGSRAGLLVLAAGLALEAAGACWAWRIASSLESLL
jgi:tight adherence protein B